MREWWGSFVSAIACCVCDSHQSDEKALCCVCPDEGRHDDLQNHRRPRSACVFQGLQNSVAFSGFLGRSCKSPGALVSCVSCWRLVSLSRRLWDVNNGVATLKAALSRTPPRPLRCFPCASPATRPGTPSSPGESTHHLGPEQLKSTSGMFVQYWPSHTNRFSAYPALFLNLLSARQT